MHGHGVELDGRKLESLNILKLKFMASKSDKEYIIRPILGSVSSLKKLKLSVDGDESGGTQATPAGALERESEEGEIRKSRAQARG